MQNLDINGIPHARGGPVVASFLRASHVRQGIGNMLKRYVVYLLRWQLSTPILAICITTFAVLGPVWATVAANVIGGLVFFWVDQFIFTSHRLGPVWSVRENVVCEDCGTLARGYRLVTCDNYNRANDPKPQFRCERCSSRKLKTLRAQGVRA
jgi:hypothetical protein